MPARWTVLASGSSGNATLLDLDGAGLLLDIGLGPRELERRLRQVGASWNSIRAVILTHTHSDHWNRRSLARLADLRVPFFCHADHVRPLQLASVEFQALQFAALVKTYTAQRAFAPIEGAVCRALELNHDGGRTFGFRVDGQPGPEGGSWSVGYAADLGSWDKALPKAFADVDVLALEFNHDVELQLASRRDRWLIHRVMGDFGHLSNVQGAKLLEECAGHSSAGRLRHVVQLHLSRECNRPALAVAAAQEAIARLNLEVELHTARQDVPGSAIELDAGLPAVQQSHSSAEECLRR